MRSNEDVRVLLSAFGSFHDSCLKEVSIRNREFVAENLAMHFDNPTRIRMLFQRQSRHNAAIELLFEDVLDFNWVQDEKGADAAAAVIFQAVCYWTNDAVYWAEDLNWQFDDAATRNEYRWIAARKGHWRLLSSALGPDALLP